ncbi:hypothetical protein ACFYUY_25285 [Kitasatospora sp. NPDC004745]|uniref:hypothetical protein n=1 Tax=Kitasatospora sp. NPDC004745 TaxID=3364019 RepID=UPI0036755DA6
MTLPSPDDRFVSTALYSVSEDAWHLELHRVDDAGALVLAVVPDEDPAQQPSVSFATRGRPSESFWDVPYEVMRWFMDQVDRQVRESRGWMGLRPELVAVVHRLREEHRGWILDEDLPGVLAELRATVPEAELPTVLEAAFGRTS